MRHRLLLPRSPPPAPSPPPLAASAATAAPAPAPPAEAAASKTIVGVAAGDPRFSTLVSLVKQAGLATTLSQGQLHRLRPDQRGVRQGAEGHADALGKDKAKLKAVLLYHVVKGRVPASKVVSLSAKTLNGASVKIPVKHGKVFLNGSTQVTKTDVMASNGVIHVINKVLLPPAKNAHAGRSGG